MLTIAAFWDVSHVINIFVFPLGRKWIISLDQYLSIWNSPLHPASIAPTDRCSVNYETLLLRCFSSPCFHSSITSLKKYIISCLHAGLLSDTKPNRQTPLVEIRWLDSNSGCSNLFLIKCLFYTLFIHFPFPIQDHRGPEPSSTGTGWKIDSSFWSIMGCCHI